MKVRLLQAESGGDDDVSRAVVAYANALAAHHDVELVSLQRTSPGRTDVSPQVTQRFLVARDTSDDAVERRVPEAQDLASRPSRMVPQAWAPDLNALCDNALCGVLPSFRSGVLITTTPGLLAAATGRLPRGLVHLHLDLTRLVSGSEALECLTTHAPAVDAVMTPTEAKAEWLRRHCEPGVALHCVPVPIDRDRFLPSRLDQPLILAPGASRRVKGGLDAIDAFASVAADIPEWRLRVIGAGNHVRLARAARRYGLFDRVEVLGPVDDPDVEWAKASISMLLSRSEPAPLAIQESFSAGVPVVAYDCPSGPSEFVDDGRTGFLVRRGDSRSAGLVLRRLAQDPDLRRRMGVAAHEVAESFAPDEFARQFAGILENAQARGRGIPAPDATPSGSASTDAVTPPAVTPAQSRADVVGLVSESLRDVSGWCVLRARGDAPPTFVVPDEQRGEALEALADAAWPAHLSVSVGEGDHWFPRRGAVTDTTRSLRNAAVAGFDLEPWPEVGGVTTHLTERAGVRVEFWCRAADGVLVAPRGTPFVDRLRESDIAPAVEVEGRSVHGVPAMRGPFVDECTFPIDAVYTWVDDGDSAWQQRYARALESAGSAELRKEASGAARFRNRDELRYSLRSLYAHAPWIRTIHVVTAGQRPAWLVDHPRVRVVDHAEILPPDALPTFNSHAIETSLHKIPGLSEHFIYFNDDVFLARPLGPERFFTAGGNFAAFLSQRTLGLDGHDDRPFVRAGINNRRLLEERFGVTNTHAVAHTPHPMRRSVLGLVEEEFAEAVQRTARASFRSPEDVSVTASLAQHYGVLTGSAHLASMDLAFVDTSKVEAKRMLWDLLDRSRDAFCIGDHHSYALSEESISQILADFFEAYFPAIPPWEIAPASMGVPPRA